MTSLRDAIGEFASRRVRPVSFPPSTLASVVDSLPAPRFEVLALPEEIGEFQERLSSRYDAVGIQGLSLKEFRDLPLTFWHGPKPLEVHGELFVHFLHRLRSEKLESVMRRFVQAFLDKFPLGAPSFKGAAEFIAADLPAFRSAYQELSRDWRAFSGSGGAKLLGVEVLRVGPQILDKVGLPEHLWTFRFVEEVFRDACRALKSTDTKQLEFLRLLAERPGVARQQAQRFPGSKAELFEGLLGSWRDKPPPPESPHKRAIMALIERVAGDPRSPGSDWTGVNDALKRVYLRWLASASLKQFLDIVERSLRGDASGVRMWPQRRRFWTAWFDTGKIDEAWVAFGRGAYDDALRASRADQNFGKGFAQLEGSSTRDHSALIMRIGEITIVEWSHNGYCWIWPPTQGRHPSLGKARYDAEDLRGGRTSIRHWPDGFEAARGWQHDVCEELWKLTGFRLQESTWKHGRTR